MESINLCSDVLFTMARERYQPENVTKNVRWVLMNYLVEKEYEDLFPNGYYQEWIKWYFTGHHICGWKGEFPQGQLIIL